MIPRDPASPVREFLGLERHDDPLQWRLDIRPRVLTHAGAVHGGALLGAAVEALEGTTGRPLVWATAQYLHHAGPTGTIDIAITPEIAGRNTTQARVTLSLGDTEVLRVFAALGTRPFPHEARWVGAPQVPPPDTGRPWSGPRDQREQVLDHYQLRFATGRPLGDLDGTPGPGTAALWCHIPDAPRPVTAGDLALVGDLLMPSLSDALGVPITANSLDNTIRVVARAEAEWVLLDVFLDAAVGGFAHAAARLWTEDGTLLAVASQTLVLRAADSEGRSTRRGRRIAGADDDA